MSISPTIQKYIRSINSFVLFLLLAIVPIAPNGLSFSFWGGPTRLAYGFPLVFFDYAGPSWPYFFATRFLIDVATGLLFAFLCVFLLARSGAAGRSAYALYYGALGALVAAIAQNLIWTRTMPDLSGTPTTFTLIALLASAALAYLAYPLRNKGIGTKPATGAPRWGILSLIALALVSYVVASNLRDNVWQAVYAEEAMRRDDTLCCRDDISAILRWSLALQTDGPWKR